MREPFASLLEPPRFDDPERTRVAYVLHWIVVTSVFALGGHVLLATLFFADPRPSWTYNGPILLGTLVANALLRRGHVQRAALVIGAGVWVSLSLNMVLRGGPLPNVLPGYLVAIFLVGLTWNARAAAGVGLASLVAVGLVVWEIVPSPAPAPPSAAQITASFAACVAAAAVLGWLAERGVRTAFAETRRSERRWAQLVESAPLGVVVLDRDLIVTRANPAAAGFVGAPSADDMIGVPLDASRAWAESTHRGVFDACFERGESAELELTGTTRFGQTVRIRAHLTPLYEPDGSVGDCMLVFEDVAKQRDLEEQLAQSQKLEALGRLAGGIAHDFNNVLTVISGFGESAWERLSEHPAAREDLDQVLGASDRAAGLTRQLLTFSRKQVTRTTVFDLNGTLASLEKMFARLIGEDVELRVELSEEAMPIEADEGQIEQVLLNLVVNARDAMPEGGLLRIATRLEPGPEERPRIVLAIEDSGVGMSPEVLQRIFDPFFTTKGAGKGTGLGLATAYGITQQAGGELRVRSEPGKGSLFEVVIPRSEQEPAARSVPAYVPRPASGPPARVLVVEDEPAVRRIVCASLEGAGYETLTAGDGEEALELVAQGAAFDLLVTDVVMPRLGGVELCERLRQGQPELPVIFVSGYTEHPRLDGHALPAGTDFLSKPFQTAQLLQSVEKALSQD